MRSLSLLGIVVQGLQKAPLVWTLIILGIVVQTSGIGICREDFWVLWSTVSPQSSSPRLPRALKALPMDDHGAFTADCSRERPRTGTTRGGGKDRDWLTTPSVDEDFRAECPWLDSEGSGGLPERADVWSGAAERPVVRFRRTEGMESTCGGSG